MKTVKKLGIVCSVFLSLFTLASCNLIIDNSKTLKPIDKSTTINPDIFHANISGNTEISKEIPVNYKDGDFDKVKKKMNDAIDIMNKNGNYNDFIKLYNEIVDFLNKIYSDYDAMYVKYSVYGDNKYQDKYLEYYDYYLELSEWYNSVRHKLVNHPFKNKFYGGISDEEIYEMIGKEKSERYYELSKKIQELQAKHLAFSNDELYSKTPELYLELVGYQNELARLEGYDNYLDYSYENEYNRDYKYKDTDEFFNNAIKYIWPKFKVCNDEISAVRKSAKSNSDYDLYAGIFNQAGFTDYMKYFDEYAYFMNDNYYKAYKHLWSKEGYYYISSEANSFEGAYTGYNYTINEPYVYFGLGYHDIFTLVHEFGHYYAYTEYKDETSYDIAEVQSQADELLFLEWYFKNNNISDSVKEYIKMNRDFNDYWTILIASLVNEFEKLVYTKENLKVDDFPKFIEQVYEKLGGYDNAKSYVDIDWYWQYVCISNSCYYISYATSLAASKELEAVAKKDLNKGKETYFKICKADFDNMHFIDVLEAAGLNNPFSEEAFKAIVA